MKKINDDAYKNIVPPSPIPERECKCGCGYFFQPKRRDQVYLNKQHADFGYNHGTRKQRAKNEIEIQKIQKRNDRILEKFFETQEQNEVTYPLSFLMADGFRQEYYIGVNKKDRVNYIYSYNYLYSLTKSQNEIFIKIRKR